MSLALRLEAVQNVSFGQRHRKRGQQRGHGWTHGGQFYIDHALFGRGRVWHQKSLPFALRVLREHHRVVCLARCHFICRHRFQSRLASGLGPMGASHGDGVAALHVLDAALDGVEEAAARRGDRVALGHARQRRQ